MEIDEEIILNKPIIRDLYEWRKWENEILNIYKYILIKKGEKILDNFQKEKRWKISKNILDSGDYIVKCSWGIDFHTKDLTYKEYKKLRGRRINKSNQRQK